MSLDEALNEKLGPLRDDIAELKQSVATNTGHNQAIVRDLAALALEVKAIKDVTPPDDDPVDTDPDPVDPPASGALSIDTSHERYTNCLKPDASSPTGYRITDPRFIQLHGEFDTIRVMNWQNMTGARDRNTTWANRITHEDYDDSVDRDRWRNGVPLEGIVEVANACKSNIWLCLYQQSAPAFWAKAGSLFDRWLDKGLHVFLEGANESWDSARGWKYHQNNEWADGMRLYAEDSVAKFRAFGENFDPHRTTRILGGQLANVGVLKTHVLPHVKPGDYDAITCSGYFGNSQHKGEDWKTGKHGLADSLEQLRQHAELAGSLGKKLCIYELNQHILDDQGLATSDAVTDGVRSMIDRAKGLSASPICLYSGVGNIYPGSPWPLYDTDYQRRRPAERLGLPKI